MRFSQRQKYHRASFVGSSYFVIMLTISSFLAASLKSKSRNHLVESGTGSKTFIEHVYLIRTENFRSKYILISYLNKFPLLSYKYNAISVFRDLLAISLAKKEGIKETEEELSILKSRMQTDNRETHLNTHLSNLRSASQC